jgi:hypothetical protein
MIGGQKVPGTIKHPSDVWQSMFAYAFRFEQIDAREILNLLLQSLGLVVVA